MRIAQTLSLRLITILIRYCAIRPPQFAEEIMDHIYPGSDSSPNAMHIRSDRLAVLYYVLAIGTLVDPGMPAFSQESECYYKLGNLALGLDNYLARPTVPVIRALVSVIIHGAISSH